MEKVLVQSKSRIDSFYGTSSERLIQIDFDSFLNDVDKIHEFVSRDKAEVDKTYKQIIAYCIISYQGKVFVTKRLKKQTEIRLHDMYSVGVGGHVNPSDYGEENILIHGMLRELNEEVFIGCPYSYHFLGLINDNSTAVNSVHVGACFEIRLQKEACRVRETEKMEGCWLDLSEIHAIYDKLEGWSKIVVNGLLEK